jgi:hypothetical protein
MNKQNKCKRETVYLCTAYLDGRNWIENLRSYGYKSGKGWKSCPYFKQRRGHLGLEYSSCVFCFCGFCGNKDAKDAAQ